MEEKYIAFEKLVYDLHQAIDPEIKSREQELIFLRCMEVVRAVPAADVRPVVRGKWESTEAEERAGWIHCSQCGFRLPSKYANNACGNCFADMRDTNG